MNGIELPDIVVLGDLNLDWSANAALPFAFADLKENGRIVWEEIRELPGGSGLMFARFARAAGLRTLLIGKVGNDLSGRMLCEWLGEQGISSAVSIDVKHATGRAFITRDRVDIRLLVNSIDNSNHQLTAEEVERHSCAISHCCMLYVSGYCIMNPDAPRTKAARRAIDLAKEHATSSRCTVVFDVVPHRIYETYSMEQFLSLTRGVDILISEAATMRRFLKLGSRDELVDRVLVRDALEHLKQHFSGVALRFGPSGCDEQLLWSAKDGKEYWDVTGHAGAWDKRGFGDMLAVRDLREFFGVAPRCVD